MLRQTSFSNHRWSLEAESIEISREAVANAHNAVLLYSIGKDSSLPPFPLLHIDTQWKFPEMIAFRDRMAVESGMELRVYTNRAVQAEGIDPFTRVQPDPRNALAVYGICL